MSKPIQLSLRPGERIYINGAVVRVDRKVTLELLNEVTFLLEAHVLQPEETTTPLRQLYFAAQTILMDPSRAKGAHDVFRQLHNSAIKSFSNDTVVAGLRAVAALVATDRTFEALRTIRAMFPIEEQILAQPPRAA